MSTNTEDDESTLYDEDATRDESDSGAKWASAVTALLGLWLVVVPTFFWEAVGVDFWNDLLVGVAVVALAGYSYYESSDEDESDGTWASGLNALLGLWMIVAPFVWGVVDVLFWNDIVVGAAIAVVAGYAAYEGRESASGLGSEQRA